MSVRAGGCVAAFAIIVAAPAARADSRLAPPDLTLRAGLEHTSVDKDDGAPSGYGPRLELEASLHPIRWFSIAVAGAYSYYSASNLHDGVTGNTYDVHFHEPWLGLRLYVHPHWRVFAGGTVWSQWERETVTGIGPASSTTWTQRFTPELVVGANVARTGSYLVQVAATYSAYSQFDGLEHVHVWSVSLGLTRRGHAHSVE